MKEQKEAEKQEVARAEKKRGKKALIVAGCVIGTIVLLGSISVILSHAIYSRSLIASIFMIRKGLTKDARTYEEELAYLEQVKSSPEKAYSLQKAVRFSTEWTVKEEQGMPVYYLNGNNNSGITVFYIHGGAYVAQPAINQWKFVDKIAKKLDVEIVAPIYPLAPHHTYEEAYRSLMNHYIDWRNENPDRKVVFMGDSAGGGLVLGMMQRARDAGVELPRKSILLSPWVDLALNNPDIKKYESADPLLSVGFLKADGEAWAGDLDPSDGRVSTLNADLSDLPETLIVQGTGDIFYPDVMLLTEKMKAESVTVQTLIGKNLPHVYPIFGFPESETAFKNICAFINADS